MGYFVKGNLLASAESTLLKNLGFKSLNTDVLKWIKVSTLSIQALAIAATIIKIKAILRGFTLFVFFVSTNSDENC